MSPKLLPPLPPFVDKQHPQTMSYRLDQQEEAIEHLAATKLETPSASLLRFAGVILSICLGLAGLASPAHVAALLRLLLP